MKYSEIFSVYFLLLIFFISVHSIYAQKETNIWYFGHQAGLDFNTSPPVVLTDGLIITGEGCASLCDTAGNLLFYTNGNTVWDKNHDTMPNGTGLSGEWYWSSTQSALIVPKPGNNTIYYIFTVDGFGGAGGFKSHSGLVYSVIDMSLNNGTGKVTDKNIFLYTPVTEKLTAVKHADCNSIWVIAHEMDSDRFLAYLVDETGVSNTPVISTIGNIHLFYIGYMKISHDGKKLASAVSSEKFITLFDFDNTTGKISNPIYLYIDNTAYGLEFSADNKKLYAGSGEIYVTSPTIYQFDISLETEDLINGSKKIIVKYNDFPRFYALQLAPDGKIYLVRWLYIAVINKPNETGDACNFKDSVIYLDVNGNGNWSGNGLPNFVQGYFNTELIIDFNFTGCMGDSTAYYDNSTGCFDSWYWNFGDNNFSTERNPLHYYTKPATYSVTLTAKKNTYVQSITKEVVIKPKVELFIPNVFTPNNDGINDKFIINLPDIDTLSVFNLKIYNRWGREVFETKNPHDYWHGENFSDGVYYYYLTFKDCRDKLFKAKGVVSILR